MQEVTNNSEPFDVAQLIADRDAKLQPNVAVVISQLRANITDRLTDGRKLAIVIEGISPRIADLVVAKMTEAQVSGKWTIRAAAISQAEYTFYVTPVATAAAKNSA